MQGRVQKWGNSLAVRIPKAFAEEVGLEENSRIDLSLVDGTVLIQPLPDRAMTLDQLLAGITDENLHQEVDTGEPVGNEAW